MVQKLTEFAIGEDLYGVSVAELQLRVVALEDEIERIRLTSQSEARLVEFTKSELFAKTFREGMEMVEEAAAYLDGPGRHDAKKLTRNDALVYASESMKLTTRLMQMASWLLVQRAVKEGEISLTDARGAKYRLLPEKSQGEEELSFKTLAGFLAGAFLAGAFFVEAVFDAVFVLAFLTGLT